MGVLVVAEVGLVYGRELGTCTCMDNGRGTGCDTLAVRDPWHISESHGTSYDRDYTLHITPPNTRTAHSSASYVGSVSGSWIGLTVRLGA